MQKPDAIYISTLCYQTENNMFKNFIDTKVQNIGIRIPSVFSRCAFRDIAVKPDKPEFLFFQKAFIVVLLKNLGKVFFSALTLPIRRYIDLKPSVSCLLPAMLCTGNIIRLDFLTMYSRHKICHWLY